MAQLTEKKLVSVREAAVLMGMGKTALYEMIEAGQFPARRLGRRIRILPADIDRFVSALPHAGTAVSILDTPRGNARGNVAGRQRTETAQERTARAWDGQK
jgi:excisionase family DNA binding protein